MIVEVCLTDEPNLSAFLGQMRSIAQSNDMQFVDGSDKTKRSLDTLGYAGTRKTSASPIVNIGVLSKDGMGLGAGNLGLPDYQVAVGFSEGASATDARKFAQQVVGLLKQRWPVEVVPDPLTSGAMPMNNCGGK